MKPYKAIIAMVTREIQVTSLHVSSMPSMPLVFATRERERERDEGSLAFAKKLN